MKKQLIFSTLVLIWYAITGLEAQEDSFIYGQVVSEGGYPIEQVNVVVDRHKLLTNHQGAFMFPSESGKKPKNVSATKKHHQMLRWGVNKNELIIILKAPLNLLEGQVVDIRLQPITKVAVSILGVSKIPPVYECPRLFYNEFTRRLYPEI